MGSGKLNAMDWHPIQGGVEILSVASCYRNQDKLQPDGPFGSNADFTLPVISAHTCVHSTHIIKKQFCEANPCVQIVLILHMHHTCQSRDNYSNNM